MVLAPPLPHSRHQVRRRRHCSRALHLQPPQSSSNLQQPPRRACQAAHRPQHLASSLHLPSPMQPQALPVTLQTQGLQSQTQDWQISSLSQPLGASVAEADQVQAGAGSPSGSSCQQIQQVMLWPETLHQPRQLPEVVAEAEAEAGHKAGADHEAVGSGQAMTPSFWALTPRCQLLSAPAHCCCRWYEVQQCLCM